MLPSMFMLNDSSVTPTTVEQLSKLGTRFRQVHELDLGGSPCHGRRVKAMRRD
jgi:hypothetical protein